MSTPPDAEIILSTSHTHGLVAITSGERFLDARNALQEAGFNSLPGGAFTAPRRGVQAARDTASALVHRAHDHGVSITTSSRPYLGDTGQDIAARLPGAWTSTVETYPRRHWQEDIVGSLWDSGDLFQAVVHDHVRCAVVLENPAGTALLLIERPEHASGYLLGAFATEEYDDNWDDRHSPRSIVLPAEADSAARAIVRTFLPDYRSALHHRRLDTVMAALNRIRPDHETLQAITESGRYSDGMPFDNPRLLKEMERSFADRGWRSFQEVLQHAPLLLSRCRPSASAWPQDAAALTRLRDALASSQDAWAEFQDLRAELYSIPATFCRPRSGARYAASSGPPSCRRSRPGSPTAKCSSARPAPLSPADRWRCPRPPRGCSPPARPSPPLPGRRTRTAETPQEEVSPCLTISVSAPTPIWASSPPRRRRYPRIWPSGF